MRRLLIRKLHSLTGLSLLEIIVAVVILAITITGLAGIFISTKRLVLHSQLRMSGGELGKYYLSPFSDAVRQDQWDSSANDYSNILGKTASPVSGETVILSEDPYPYREYTSAYKVEVPPGFVSTSPMRKVTFTLNWIE
ncbi:MAG: hypothetical protein V1925_00640 [Candidatus Omnitrophota bacterium]